LKVIRTQVILKASSKSCRNPKNRNLQKIAETLETLGPNFQNARNFTLRVFGGALEKAVLSYAKIIPNIQVLRAETPHRKEGHTNFLETLGGSYGSAEKRGRLVDACAMGSSRPML
jgi:hypothetical protein